MSGLRDRYDWPWETLQAAAWSTRRVHHPDVLAFAVPGARRYETEVYRNHPRRFASVSVTGRACALQCAHCQGQLLDGMAQRDADKARADGRAYEIKVQGEATANATRILGEALAAHPLVVEYKKVEKWGGNFPGTFMGGETGVNTLWSLPGVGAAVNPSAARGGTAAGTATGAKQ